jgi:hypothetical protein
MKTFLTAISLITSICLMGCVTPPTKEQMEKETANFTLPHKADPKMATIYVVRPEMIGTLVRFNVFVNDKEPISEMGWTRGSQHIYFQVPPGNYTILSKAENWAEAFIGAKPGQTYFIRQDAQIGIIMARNTITEIDPVEGKYHVMKTSLGEIIKRDTPAVVNKAPASEALNKK